MVQRPNPFQPQPPRTRFEAMAQLATATPEQRRQALEHSDATGGVPDLLAPYLSEDGRLDTVAALEGGITPTQLSQRGVPAQSIRSAQQFIAENAAIQPFRIGEDRIDVQAYMESGGDPEILISRGVSPDAIQSTQQRMAALATVQPFLDDAGNLTPDVVGQVPDGVLQDLGVSADAIAEIRTAQEQRQQFDAAHATVDPYIQGNRVDVARFIEDGGDRAALNTLGITDAVIDAAIAPAPDTQPTPESVSIATTLQPPATLQASHINSLNRQFGLIDTLIFRGIAPGTELSATDRQNLGNRVGQFLEEVGMNLAGMRSAYTLDVSGIQRQIDATQNRLTILQQAAAGQRDRDWNNRPITPEIARNNLPTYEAQLAQQRENLGQAQQALSDFDRYSHQLIPQLRAEVDRRMQGLVGGAAVQLAAPSFADISAGPDIPGAVDVLRRAQIDTAGTGQFAIVDPETGQQVGVTQDAQTAVDQGFHVRPVGTAELRRPTLTDDEFQTRAVELAQQGDQQGLINLGLTDESAADLLRWGDVISRLEPYGSMAQGFDIRQAMIDGAVTPAEVSETFGMRPIDVRTELAGGLSEEQAMSPEQFSEARAIVRARPENFTAEIRAFYDPEAEAARQGVILTEEFAPPQPSPGQIEFNLWLDALGSEGLQELIRDIHSVPERFPADVRQYFAPSTEDRFQGVLLDEEHGITTPAERQQIRAVNEVLRVGGATYVPGGAVESGTGRLSDGRVEFNLVEIQKAHIRGEIDAQTVTSLPFSGEAMAWALARAEAELAPTSPEFVNSLAEIQSEVDTDYQRAASIHGNQILPIPSVTQAFNQAALDRDFYITLSQGLEEARERGEITEADAIAFLESWNADRKGEPMPFSAAIAQAGRETGISFAYINPATGTALMFRDFIRNPSWVSGGFFVVSAAADVAFFARPVAQGIRMVRVQTGPALRGVAVPITEMRPIAAAAAQAAYKATVTSPVIATRLATAGAVASARAVAQVPRLTSQAVNATVQYARAIPPAVMAEARALAAATGATVGEVVRVVRATPGQLRNVVNEVSFQAATRTGRAVDDVSSALESGVATIRAMPGAVTRTAEIGMIDTSFRVGQQVADFSGHVQFQVRALAQATGATVEEIAGVVRAAPGQVRRVADEIALQVAARTGRAVDEISLAIQGGVEALRAAPGAALGAVQSGIERTPSPNLVAETLRRLENMPDIAEAYIRATETLASEAAQATAAARRFVESIPAPNLVAETLRRLENLPDVGQAYMSAIERISEAFARLSVSRGGGLSLDWIANIPAPNLVAQTLRRLENAPDLAEAYIRAIENLSGAAGRGSAALGRFVESIPAPNLVAETLQWAERLPPAVATQARTVTAALGAAMNEVGAVSGRIASRLGAEASAVNRILTEEVPDLLRSGFQEIGPAVLRARIGERVLERGAATQAAIDRMATRIAQATGQSVDAVRAVIMDEIPLVMQRGSAAAWTAAERSIRDLNRAVDDIPLLIRQEWEAAGPAILRAGERVQMAAAELPGRVATAVAEFPPVRFHTELFRDAARKPIGQFYADIWQGIQTNWDTAVVTRRVRTAPDPVTPEPIRPMVRLEGEIMGRADEFARIYGAQHPDLPPVVRNLAQSQANYAHALHVRDTAAANMRTAQERIAQQAAVSSADRLELTTWRQLFNAADLEVNARREVLTRSAQDYVLAFRQIAADPPTPRPLGEFPTLQLDIRALEQLERYPTNAARIMEMDYRRFLLDPANRDAITSEIARLERQVSQIESTLSPDVLRRMQELANLERASGAELDALRVSPEVLARMRQEVRRMINPEVQTVLDNSNSRLIEMTSALRELDLNNAEALHRARIAIAQDRVILQAAQQEGRGITRLDLPSLSTINQPIPANRVNAALVNLRTQERQTVEQLNRLVGEGGAWRVESRYELLPDGTYRLVSDAGDQPIIAGRGPGRPLPGGPTFDDYLSSITGGPGASRVSDFFVPRGMTASQAANVRGFRLEAPLITVTGLPGTEVDADELELAPGRVQIFPPEPPRRRTTDRPERPDPRDIPTFTATPAIGSPIPVTTVEGVTFAVAAPDAPTVTPETEPEIVAEPVPDDDTFDPFNPATWPAIETDAEPVTTEPVPDEEEAPAVLPVLPDDTPLLDPITPVTPDLDPAITPGEVEVTEPTPAEVTPMFEPSPVSLPEFQTVQEQIQQQQDRLVPFTTVIQPFTAPRAPALAPTTEPRPADAPATVETVSPALAPLTEFQQVSEQLRQLQQDAAQQIQHHTGLEAGTQQHIQSATELANQLQRANQLQQRMQNLLQRAPQLAPQLRPMLQTLTRLQLQLRPRVTTTTMVRPPTPPRVPRVPRPPRIPFIFALPDGDGEPDVVAEITPNVIGWHQGNWQIRKNLITGEKEYMDNVPGVPIAASRESFRVLEYGPEVPRTWHRTMGAVRYRVGPDGINYFAGDPIPIDTSAYVVELPNLDSGIFHQMELNANGGHNGSWGDVDPPPLPQKSKSKKRKGKAPKKRGKGGRPTQQVIGIRNTGPQSITRI